MAPPRAKNPPQVGFIMLTTGDVQCDVMVCSSSVMEVEVPDSMHATDTLRLVFQSEGAMSGTIRILASVISTVATGGGRMAITLRYMALHSTAGKLCLREFLTEALGHTEVFDDAFKEGAGGWFYGFRTTKPAAKPSRRAKESPAVESDAAQDSVEEEVPVREVRVAVRIPAACRIGSENHKCQAYNISYSGVYVLLDASLPPEGETVEVALSIALHVKSFKVYLRGVVTWSVPGMTATGGGVGVRITQVRDGHDGKAWREYVDREAEFK
jgi:hypothetical protein